MATTQASAAARATGDFMPLHGIDHVELYVGNALQSAYFYAHALGFREVAYAGLETGLRNEAGYVLRQGDITFVLASPLTRDHPDNQRLVMHGDGVQDIAFEVDDVQAVYEAVTGRVSLETLRPSWLLFSDGFRVSRSLRRRTRRAI